MLSDCQSSSSKLLAICHIHEHESLVLSLQSWHKKQCKCEMIVTVSLLPMIHCLVTNSLFSLTCNLVEKIRQSKQACTRKSMICAVKIRAINVRTHRAPVIMRQCKSTSIKMHLLDLVLLGEKAIAKALLFGTIMSRYIHLGLNVFGQKLSEFLQSVFD